MKNIIKIFAMTLFIAGLSLFNNVTLNTVYACEGDPCTQTTQCSSCCSPASGSCQLGQCHCTSTGCTNCGSAWADSPCP